MLGLVINRVKYSGRNYFYESPLLTRGLNILSAENGHGKTTFSSLIYFGLGGNPRFLKNNINEKHVEIVEDEDNFAELEITIGDENFNIRRFIGHNDIIVNDHKANKVEIFPVFKAGNKELFSHWISKKLGLPVLGINNGSAQWKLAFLDYLRLIYHSQKSAPASVYKKPDNDNYVSDSSSIRKTIFELLVGKSFTDLYVIRGKVKSDEKTKNELEGGLRVFDQALKVHLNGKKTENAISLQGRIDQINDQLGKLEISKSLLESIPSNSIENGSEIVGLKHKLSIQLIAQQSLAEKYRTLNIEIVGLLATLKNLELEISQIEKILFTHESLSLFSPETCPICLKTVERAKNHCICGNRVLEEEYERFFYSTQEYVEILKTKNKNKETLIKAIDSCNLEQTEINEKVLCVENLIDKVKKTINNNLKNTELRVDTKKINDFNEKILKLRSEKVAVDNQLRIELDRERLSNKLDQLQKRLNKNKNTLKALEANASNDIVNIKDDFCVKYSELMKKSVSDVNHCSLGNDYEPIINRGEYREHSIEVPKRLLYYLTLFQMSVESLEMPFPRFLLIDTPKTHGIDSDKFKKVLGNIESIVSENSSLGQIILTTGIEDYPPSLEEYIFRRYKDGDKLLVKTKES